MFDKLKQLRQMQKQAKEMQKALSQEIITVTQGDIEIKINGNMEIQSIDIKNIDDKEKLEKDIQQGVNDAIKQAQKTMAQKMMSGGFNLPGM